MVEEPLEEMGPIDYVVIEWPGRQPTGEALPLILDLVDRGIIRILDIAFMVKDEDGSTAAISTGRGRGFGEFEGASSGLIGQDDLEEAATALNPGTSAAVLVWENRWAAPVAVDAARAPAASSSPAAGFPSRPSSPRSTRPRRPPRSRGHHHAGLLRGVARTAVVAGTATAVSNRVSRRQARRWSQQSGYQDEPRIRSRRRPPPPRRRPGAADPIAQLKELAALKRAGNPHRRGVRGPEGQDPRHPLVDRAWASGGGLLFLAPLLGMPVGAATVAIAGKMADMGAVSIDPRKELG